MKGKLWLATQSISITRQSDAHSDSVRDPRTMDKEIATFQRCSAIGMLRSLYEDVSGMSHEQRKHPNIHCLNSADLIVMEKNIMARSKFSLGGDHCTTQQQPWRTQLKRVRLLSLT